VERSEAESGVQEANLQSIQTEPRGSSQKLVEPYRDNSSPVKSERINNSCVKTMEMMKGLGFFESRGILGFTWSVTDTFLLPLCSVPLLRVG
jgi:hypothetical protein